jgi:hypothetical protein
MTDRLSSNDRQLIAEVARVWVDGDGAVDGFIYCSRHIRAAIAAELERRKTAQDETQQESGLERK